MNILLLNPPHLTKYPQPPLGLAKIASMLEKNGHSVEILDARALTLSEGETIEMIREKRPDMLGITSMTPTINSALRLAKRIGEILEDCIIVLGGPHVTILPEETLLKVPDVDIVVIGEGELAMLDLVETLEEDRDRISQVLGIAYRDKHGVKRTPARPSILDLSSLPVASYHLLPIGKYRPHPPFGRKLPFMTVETSRGCPYRCIFCSKPIFGTKYRSYSPTYVVNEIEMLIEKHGVREIEFIDDTFTLDGKRITALCQEMKSRGLSIPWSCGTRVNLVNKEILELMKEAGCYMISYGVESGSQSILDNLKKDITLEQIRHAFRITHEIGIETIAYFMIGSPSETSDTIKKTIEFAKELDPDFAQFSITTPFPGTELFELAVERGMEADEWDKYIYAGVESLPHPIFLAETLSQEDLRNLNLKAYRSFYLRPRYVWKRIKKMRSLDRLKSNIMGFRMLFDMIS